MIMIADWGFDDMYQGDQGKRNDGNLPAERNFTDQNISLPV